MNTKKHMIDFNKILLIVFTSTFSLLIKFPNEKISVNKYFLFISIPLLLGYYALKLKKLKTYYISFLILIYIIYYVFQDIYVSNMSAGSGVFWWVFLLLFLPYFNLQKRENLELSIKIFFISIIIILFIDFIYRFYFAPWLIYRGISLEGIRYNFYLYKFGLIGGDTNMTGIISSLCFSASLILKEKKIIDKKYSIIFFIFTVFTFSRAAIITSIFIALYKRVKRKKINNIVLVILIVFFIAIGLFILMHDKSGRTKILFFQEASNKFFKFNIKEMLFGINHNFAKIDGHYPHLLYLLLVLEKGIMGLVLFITFIICLLKKNKNLKLILLTYLIEGFSYVTLSSPTLSYLIIIFICLKKYNFIERKK